MKTIRLWLVQDKEIPRFQRLQWKVIEVSIEDVLLKGVHPWMGGNKHLSLVDEFLRRLHQKPFKIAELDEFGYCEEILAPHSPPWDRASRIERLLKTIQEDVCFVEEITYLELMEIAKTRLIGSWNHATAKSLAEGVHPGFQELRRFLKEKDKNIKLSGYGDIDTYDLGRILSLEDFEQQDNLILSKGIPTLNFRRNSFLDSVTDSTGRLRLVPEINEMSLAERAGGPDYAGLVWQVTRKGRILTLRPDIGGSHAKRIRAKHFASRWRSCEGRLVFKNQIEDLARMVEDGLVEPAFPSLTYGLPCEAPSAKAALSSSRVEAFQLRRFPGRRCSGGVLKEILRVYKVPMTGTKEVLLKKLATLAAHQYRQRLPELNEFFSKNQYIRANYQVPHACCFPLLADLPHLDNLLLTMYALKHLRGSAILEAGHENNTYSEKELAMALVHEKVKVGGSFLPVA